MNNTSRPNRDEVKGKIHEATGTVKEKVGRAVGDADLETRGASERAGGQIQSGFGKAKRKTADALKNLGKKINR
jgi:uncharacterized protein YjbJ (UPF0337 family)